MMKAETWINMAIKPTEIDQFPFDIISEHAAKETELIDLNDQQLCPDKLMSKAVFPAGESARNP